MDPRLYPSGEGAIGTEAPAVGIIKKSVSFAAAQVTAATAAWQDVTVPGAKTTDAVIVNPPAFANAVGVAGARVKSANTVSVNFVNPTAGNLTPTSGTYVFTLIRFA